jgi:hypothetical protein
VPGSRHLATHLTSENSNGEAENAHELQKSGLTAARR